MLYFVRAGKARIGGGFFCLLAVCQSAMMMIGRGLKGNYGSEARSVLKKKTNTAQAK